MTTVTGTVTLVVNLETDTEIGTTCAPLGRLADEVIDAGLVLEETGVVLEDTSVVLTDPSGVVDAA